MSNRIDDGEGASALDCPVVDGQRQIQHVRPRVADVGGVRVSRVLPVRHRRIVGPWCFLDHAVPAHPEDAGGALDVGPHPHTGLQTVTWMLEGAVRHRDSLGNDEIIRPGTLNLMTAGRGIAHAEAAVPGEHRLNAVQLWIALPEAARHTQPRFDQYPDLPRWRTGNVEVTLLAGSFAGLEAPTRTFSPLVGVELASPAADRLTLPLRETFEHAVFAVTGDLDIDGQAMEPDTLAYLGRGRDQATLSFAAGSRAILIGGEPNDADFRIWWNFLGSKAEIAEAQRAWEAGDARFGAVPHAGSDRLMPPPLPWRG
ncbi:hypothetical protein SAMN05216241_10687 [Limimonas halophila]|uniref:Pirin n=1 Tax=Limimonas halophila TaxID=1082479 RepID=A0A1G7S1R2_9PROT|nr:pirin family protein [Limimonas halophila]SDG16931.1 hypothetical protein SAMN05216241_10687 [Limimonas halophila]